jgi:hypothetical protein
MAKSYTVSDGKLMLILEPAGGGWDGLTSPMDPALITQARSIEAAFFMARDAQKALRAARAKLARRLDGVEAGPKKKRRNSAARRPQKGARLRSRG